MKNRVTALIWDGSDASTKEVYQLLHYVSCGCRVTDEGLLYIPKDNGKDLFAKPNDMIYVVEDTPRGTLCGVVAGGNL